MSIQAGKCYLFEPGSRTRLVEAVTPDGKVQYAEQSGTDSGGTSISRTTVSREQFAKNVVREVPCPSGSNSSGAGWT